MGLGQGREKISLEHLFFVPESKEAREYSENYRDMSKEHRNQLKGNSTGQIESNLGIKINNDSKEL